MEKFALWILKNSTVKIRPEADFKIRPAVLLCQNPSPGTSGYLEKIPRTGDVFSTKIRLAQYHAFDFSVQKIVVQTAAVHAVEREKGVPITERHRFPEEAVWKLLSRFPAL